MMPRPIHRRVSLWLGLFVACFLAWAWWDSRGYVTSAGVQGKIWSCGFVRAKGETIMMWAPSRLAFGMSWGWFARDTVIPADWHMDAKEELRGAFRDIRLCGVPDAVAGVCFLGLWGGWMVWRGRRTRMDGMKSF